MTSGEDWLMRPVVAGMCKYESLLEGNIRLLDIAKMNEALDLRDYNTQSTR
jgi:hypothetical protein